MVAIWCRPAGDTVYSRWWGQAWLIADCCSEPACVAEVRFLTGVLHTARLALCQCQGGVVMRAHGDAAAAWLAAAITEIMLMHVGVWPYVVFLVVVQGSRLGFLAGMGLAPNGRCLGWLRVCTAAQEATRRCAHMSQLPLQEDAKVVVEDIHAMCCHLILWQKHGD